MEPGQQLYEDIEAIKADTSQLKRDVEYIKLSIAGNKELGIEGMLDRFHKHEMKWTMDKMEMEGAIRDLRARTQRIEKKNFKSAVITSTVTSILGMGIGAWIKAKFLP